MRDRWYLKGSSAPDPAVGAAQQANAAVAARAEDWNENFYNTYVAPTLTQAMKESETNLGRQGQVFDLTMQQAKEAQQRYEQYGVPAENAYYKMVQDYSAPDYQEQQARAAIGDVRTAEAGQAATQARQLRSLGIDPTSPAAMAASSNVALQNAATEAGAATRARDAAKTLGMSLTSDAANFGRGGQSGILGFSGAASGASSAGATGANQTAAVAPGSAANVNAGLGLAQKAYGANLDSSTELQKAYMAQPSPMAGLGQLVGQLGSAAITTYSDRRLKKHTRKIGTAAQGIGVWLFHYIWEPVTAPFHVGYMADEVEPFFPDAIVVDANGYKLVNHSKVAV